jgi:hypothetical protein
VGSGLDGVGSMGCLSFLVSKTLLLRGWMMSYLVGGGAALETLVVDDYEMMTILRLAVQLVAARSDRATRIVGLCGGGTAGRGDRIGGLREGHLMGWVMG